MDAMKPESEYSGSEKSIHDAGDDAEVQIGDLALAVAPAKPFSAKSKITKGKGKGKGSRGSVRRRRERTTLAGVSLGGRLAGFGWSRAILSLI